MADPDLQISEGGGGGGHLDPEIRGEDRSPKNFFSSLRATVWSKNKGGPAPLDPPLYTTLPGEPFFRLLDFGKLEERLCMDRVTSLLSMRGTLLGYRFEPRPNS